MFLAPSSWPLQSCQGADLSKGAWRNGEKPCPLNAHLCIGSLEIQRPVIQKEACSTPTAQLPHLRLGSHVDHGRREASVAAGCDENGECSFCFAASQQPVARICLMQSVRPACLTCRLPVQYAVWGHGQLEGDFFQLLLSSQATASIARK